MEISNICQIPSHTQSFDTKGHSFPDHRPPTPSTLPSLLSKVEKLVPFTFSLFQFSKARKKNMGICESEPIASANANVVNAATNVRNEPARIPFAPYTMLECGECHEFVDLADEYVVEFADKNKRLCHHWDYKLSLTRKEQIQNQILFVPTLEVICPICSDQSKMTAFTSNDDNAGYRFNGFGKCMCGYGYMVKRFCETRDLVKRFGLPRHLCRDCQGIGERKYPKFDICSNCKHTGGLPSKKFLKSKNKKDKNGRLQKEFVIECHVCKGRGVVIDGYTLEKCKSCRPSIVSSIMKQELSKHKNKLTPSHILDPFNIPTTTQNSVNSVDSVTTIATTAVLPPNTPIIHLRYNLSSTNNCSTTPAVPPGGLVH
jgi:hypothetical protein